MPTGGSIFTASVSFGLILMAILASVLPFWTFNLGDGMIKMSMTPWRACLTVTFAGDSSEKCEDTATYFHDMHQLMAVLNGGSMSTEEVARRLHTGDWEGSSSSGTNAGSNSNANTWTPVPDDVNACGDTSVHEVLIKVARIGFIVVCLLLVSHGVAALMAHRASIMILGGIMFFFGSAPSCFLVITYWIPFCGSLSKSLSDFTGSSAGSGIYPALILGVLIWINGILGCCCAQRPVAMQPTSVVYMPLAPGSVQQQQTVVYVQAGQPYQQQQMYPQAQYQQPEPVQGSIYQEDLYKDNANV